MPIKNIKSTPILKPAPSRELNNIERSISTMKARWALNLASAINLQDKNQNSFTKARDSKTTNLITNLQKNQAMVPTMGKLQGI
jgi:hypothetical protein